MTWQRGTIGFFYSARLFSGRGRFRRFPKPNNLNIFPERSGREAYEKYSIATERGRFGRFPKPDNLNIFSERSDREPCEKNRVATERGGFGMFSKPNKLNLFSGRSGREPCEKYRVATFKAPIVVLFVERRTGAEKRSASLAQSQHSSLRGTCTRAGFCLRGGRGVGV